MKRISRILCLSLFVCVVVPASAPAGNGPARSSQSKFHSEHKVSEEPKSSRMDWEPVMEAIIQVESEGDRLAKCGNQVGAMQIKPILVEECNRILELRNSKKRFTLQDRYSVAKSKEMFVVYQSYYNTKNDVEYAIRSWNGGNRFNRRATQRYYEKVSKLLNEIS